MSEPKAVRMWAIVFHGSPLWNFRNADKKQTIRAFCQFWNLHHGYCPWWCHRIFRDIRVEVISDGK